MAATVRVAGPIQVKIKPESSGSLQLLGYSEAGINFRHLHPGTPVYSDERGGPEGVPIDFLYLGEMAMVSMELSKVDWSVANTVRAGRSAASTMGVMGTIGTLLVASGNTFRLLLDSTADPYNFLRAKVDDIVEIPAMGARQSKLSIAFTCIPNDAGVLWNNTTD